MLSGKDRNSFVSHVLGTLMNQPYLTYHVDSVVLPFCWRFEFALQKGLEKSSTCLPSFDMFLREPINNMAFPPGVLLAGLIQWQQGSDGKQPIAYRVMWTRPGDHTSCAEMTEASRPTCNLRLSWSGNSQATYHVQSPEPTRADIKQTSINGITQTGP